MESDDKKDYQIISRNKPKLRKSLNEHKVCAHKFMLAARSTVFCDLFRKSAAKSSLLEKKELGVTENQQEIIIIKDTSVKAFRVVLDYIYLDNLNLLDDITG